MTNFKNLLRHIISATPGDLDDIPRGGAKVNGVPGSVPLCYSQLPLELPDGDVGGGELGAGHHPALQQVLPTKYVIITS